MKRKAVPWIAMISLIGSYASAQKEQTEPAPAADKKGTAVVVQVVDEREGDREPDVVGKMSSTVGVPKKLRTEGKVPLADVIKKDLATDLESLGYVPSGSEAAPRRIEVIISTWDCSVYSPGFKTAVRFWYDLEIRVTDAKGRVLHEQTLKDDNPERRKLPMKTKPKNVPSVLYQDLLPQIVRDNQAVLKALKN